MFWISKDLEVIFSSMIESVIILEFVIDENDQPINYKLLYCNETFENLFKVKRENIIGKLVTDVFNLEKLTYINKFYELFKNKQYHKLEIPFLNRIYSVTVTVFQEDKLLCIARDITEEYTTFKIPQDVFNLIPTGLIVYQYEEPDKLILMKSNIAAEEITKVKLREFIGKEINEIFPNISETLLFKSFLEVVKNKKVFFIENLYHTDNNFDDYFKILAFPLSEKWLAVTVENITELKKAYLKLKEEEEFKFRLLQTIPDIVVLTDLEGNINYINRNTINEFGIKDSSKIIGMNVISFIDDEDKDRALKNLKQSDTKEILRNEYKIKMLNNEIRYADIIRSTFYSNDSTPKGFLYVVRNITERKLYESKLKLFYNVFEQSPISIFITDNDGKVEYVNSVFEKLSGYSIDDLRNNKLNILKSGKHDNEFYKNLWDTIKKGEVWQGEFLNKKKNGELYWDFTIIYPLKDEYNNIVKFISFKQDITEKKKINEELIKAIEKAEESEKLKTAFLQNMSHEIRTPLIGILGFSDLLQYKNITYEEIYEYTNLIKKSGKRLIEIINNVLELSKIETNQLSINYNVFSVKELLENIYSQFKDVAAEKGLKLIKNNKYNDVFIKSDESKVLQIFNNLLQNAIKFTYKGKIEYGFEIKDKYIEFYVADTGIGIDEKNFDIIFKRFHQLDFSINRNFEGMGLGLPLCKGLIEKLGGDIWLTSKIDVGTTFYFRLPLKAYDIQ